MWATILIQRKNWSTLCTTRFLHFSLFSWIKSSNVKSVWILCPLKRGQCYMYLELTYNFTKSFQLVEVSHMINVQYRSPSLFYGSQWWLLIFIWESYNHVLIHINMISSGNSFFCGLHTWEPSVDMGILAFYYVWNWAPSSTRFWWVQTGETANFLSQKFSYKFLLDVP